MKNRKVLSWGVVLLLLASFFVLSVPTVWATAPEFPINEGFENWNDVGWLDSAGFPTAISGASARSGSNGARFNASWSTTYLGKDCSASEADAVKNFSLSMYYRINQLTPPTNFQFDLAYGDSYYNGAIWEIGIGNNATGNFWFLLSEAPTASGATAIDGLFGDVLVLDQWYLIEIDYVCDDVNGLIKFAIDGVEVASFEGDTKKASDDWGVDGYMNWGAGVQFSLSGVSFNVDLDDLDMDYYDPSDVSVSATDLEDIDDDGADWVFTDWRYYTFEATVEGLPDLSELVIYFNVTTGSQGIVTVALLANDDDEWELASSITDSNENRFGEPVRLKSGSFSNSSVTFLVWFNDQCLDQWESGIDVYVWANQTTGIEYDFQIAGSEVFRIYSKGGFTMNYMATDPNRSGKMIGEEWASMFAYNGTSVRNEIWFRDLQHIKMLPDVQFYAGLETFQITSTMEYSLGDGNGWVEGWEVIVIPSFVSYTGIFASNVWINMTIQYWVNNGTGYDQVKSDVIYMFYHGSVQTAGDVGHFRYWADLWFNSINASSTGGARINAYEFPMVDNADLWLRWLANNWGAKDDVLKESSYMNDIYDADGNLISSEQIKMVRVRQRLDVFDADAGQLVILRDYDALDYTKSPDFPLTGVQTPVFDETKLPTVGNTGVIGAIFSMFSGIGQWLSENVIFGGLNLWGNFVAFLDTIAGWLGAPKFFSNLFDWIGNGVTYLANSVTYAFQLIANFFVMIGSLLASFITTLGELVGGVATTITYLGDIMSGAIGGAGNLWDQLGVLQWLSVGIIFYPLYLVILWDQEGLDAVIQQVTWIFGIAGWLFGFFVSIAQTVLTFIYGLIESVPVAE